MSLKVTAQVMREKAEEQGGTSLLTHTPDGGTLIYIGPNEDDVAGMLVRAIAEIQSKRGTPWPAAH